MEELLEILLGADSDANLQLADPALVNYYHDLKQRCVWIDGDIDKDTLAIIQLILRWNREDQSLPIEQRKPIRLFFHSPGGSLDVEESIISVIRLSKTPIYGIAIGLVGSAASLIYLSCPRRLALPNAYFIFHRGSCSNVSGSYDEIQAAMADYRTQVEKMEQFYIENTDYTEEEVHSKISTDWYIRGDELLERKIITEWVEDINILL